MEADGAGAAARAVEPAAPGEGGVLDEELALLAAEGLSPLFWPSTRPGQRSAWHGHVPFAHWIVAAARPRVLVELGTYTGVSYAAFCEACARMALPARCTAVDSWQGDTQAGLYGPEVLEELRAFHDPRYGAFSTLLPARFDDALAWFADGSVDLLHIDGLHTYDAVRHDFESWLPKLSDRAVVLFHDTEVRDGEFGVWRLWEEVRARWPGFGFTHAFGLGVLAVGARVAPAVAALCRLPPDGALAHALRLRFQRLGEREVLNLVVQQLRGRLWEREEQIAALEREVAGLRQDLLAQPRTGSPPATPTGDAMLPTPRM